MNTLRELSRDEARTLFRDHPHLCGMWDKMPELTTPWLRRKPDRSMLKWGCDPKRKSRGISIIIDETRYPIGFTGYWIDEAIPETARLCWTGIIKEKRRQGYGEKAINEIIAIIQKDTPIIRYLSESYPISNGPVAAWFARLGFQPWDDPEKNGLGIRHIKTVSVRKEIHHDHRTSN
jgi:RimJ/RimL family protein N-acetyltransferase